MRWPLNVSHCEIQRADSVASRQCEVSGSSYAYEMDPTFDLSRREERFTVWSHDLDPREQSQEPEAQLAVVEFCRRLRWEAKLKARIGICQRR